MPHSTTFLTQLLAATPPPSPKSDRWDEFENDSGTFYDDDQDFIRVITGEGIPQQSEFDSFPWDSMSESNCNITTSSAGYYSTASHKQFLFHDVKRESENAFMSKHPKNWIANDIMQWTIYVAQCHNINYEHMRMPSFNVDGSTLCEMKEEDFVSRDLEFGRTLYSSLRSIISELEYKGISPSSTLPTFNSSFPIPTLTDHGEWKICPGAQSNTSDFGSDKESDGPVVEDDRPKKRPPGRPKGIRSKRKPEKRCGRLWEFIRDLLLNRDYCPSLICWDNHDEGIFRFVRSEKVAQLWGTIKENPKMTYEKLSRAMRYYYKSKVLQPVLGRRLVYKFGPTAKGWRTPNPNFRLN